MSGVSNYNISHHQLQYALITDIYIYIYIYIYMYIYIYIYMYIYMNKKDTQNLLKLCSV